MSTPAFQPTESWQADPLINGALLWELTTDRTVNTQATDEIGTFTFVAPAASYVLEFRAQFDCQGSGDPAFIVAIGFIDPPGSRIILRIAGSDDNDHQPGVTEFKVRALLQGEPDSTQCLTNRLRLTGLTPGRTYTVQVCGGTASGFKNITMGRNPIKPCFSPDRTEIWTASLSTKEVHPIIVGGRAFWTKPYSVAGSLDPAASARYTNTLGTAIPTGHASQFPVFIQVASARVAVAQHDFVNASSICVINRTTRAIQATTALPVAELIQGMILDPNQNTVYVTTSGGKVYPFTLSSATFGSALTLGGDLRQPAINAAGTVLYVPSFSGNGVYPVPLPGFTAPTIVNLGAGSGPSFCAIGPDDFVWCTLQGASHAGRIMSITPALSLGVTVNTLNSAGVVGSGPTTCTISAPSNGQPPIIYWSNGTAIGYSFTDDGLPYDRIINVFTPSTGGVTTDAGEYVFMVWDSGTEGHIGSWSSSNNVFDFNTTIPNYLGHYLEAWGSATLA